MPISQTGLTVRKVADLVLGATGSGLTTASFPDFVFANQFSADVAVSWTGAEEAHEIVDGSIEIPPGLFFEGEMEFLVGQGFEIPGVSTAWGGSAAVEVDYVNGYVKIEAQPKPLNLGGGVIVQASKDDAENGPSFLLEFDVALAEEEEEEEADRRRSQLRRGGRLRRGLRADDDSGSGDDGDDGDDGGVSAFQVEIKGYIAAICKYLHALAVWVACGRAGGPAGRRFLCTVGEQVTSAPR